MPLVARAIMPPTAPSHRWFGSQYAVSETTALGETLPSWAMWLDDGLVDVCGGLASPLLLWWACSLAGSVSPFGTLQKTELMAPPWRQSHSSSSALLPWRPLSLAQSPLSSCAGNRVRIATTSPQHLGIQTHGAPRIDVGGMDTGGQAGPANQPPAAPAQQRPQMPLWARDRADVRMSARAVTQARLGRTPDILTR